MSKCNRFTYYAFITNFVILLFVNYFGYSQQKIPTNFQKDSIKIEELKSKPDKFLGKLLYDLTPKKYKQIVKYETIYRENEKAYLKIKPQKEISTLQLEYTQNQSRKDLSEKIWDSIYGIVKTKTGPTDNALTHLVYGYHPYWMGTAYESYNFSLLSRVAYFSYQLNPKTGHYNTIHNWEHTKLIDLAHKYNCKVDLCVTNFGEENNKTFLNNEKAQNNLTNVLIQLLNQRNADGVNINFEGIASEDREKFVVFISNLSYKLKLANSKYVVSITIPAVDWNKSYDITNLSNSVDFFIMMGYDYYGKNSSIAGPNAPLKSGDLWHNLNLEKSINYYVNEGISPLKLIVALPYYGKQWKTTSSSIPSASKDFISTITYRNIRKKYDGNTSFFYDTLSLSKAFIFKNSSEPNQIWVDDENTLAFKYDFIKKRGLGGLGIWALGYDNGYLELWNLLKSKFTFQNQQLISYVQDTSKIGIVDTVYITKDSNLYGSIFSNPLILNKNAQQLFNNDNIILEQDSLAIETIPVKLKIKKSLNRTFRILSLIFLILVLFSFVGFVLSLLDYNVREAFFSKEFRIYLFLLLVGVFALVSLRIFNIIRPIELIFILGALFGIISSIIIYNLARNKKTRKAELTP